MENGLYYLDTIRVRCMMSEQELKQYWVADQAGVHVTTFRRWLSRRICQVRGKHIVKLASVLGAEPIDIILKFHGSIGRDKFTLASLPVSAETA